MHLLFPGWITVILFDLAAPINLSRLDFGLYTDFFILFFLVLDCNVGMVFFFFVFYCHSYCLFFLSTITVSNISRFYMD